MAARRSPLRRPHGEAFTVEPLGDAALLLRWDGRLTPESALRVRAAADALARASVPGVLEGVPACATLTVHYDPLAVRAEGGLSQLEAALRACLARTTSAAAPRGDLRIPVVYGGKFGPDLETLAERAGLTPREYAERHAAALYHVGALGFSPGFPYLIGLPAELEAPRRETPRTRVPAGSVAIGGAHTGIYPAETPGGWNLIGRTPMPLFMPGRRPPSRLRVGDRVRFEPIEAEAFDQWRPRA